MSSFATGSTERYLPDVASRPLGALALLLVAFAAAPHAAADDLLSAARARLDASSRGPSTDPYPNGLTGFSFYPGSPTYADYRWLGNPSTSFLPSSALDFRDRLELIPLAPTPHFLEITPPSPTPGLEGCTSAWFASNACLLRFYP